MNITLILAVTLLNFILGMVWYGPLFGKAWAKILGVSIPTAPEEKEAMRKKMISPMILTFIGTFLTNIVLYISVSVGDILAGVVFAAIFWLGFIVPSVANGIIWDKMSKKTMFHKFLIQAGFSLVSFVVAAIVFGIFSK